MIDVRAHTTSSARSGLRFLLRGISAAIAVLFITSCGNDLFIVGTPVITLTAQPGHFTSYIVTIDEIEMTRKDGTIIELPTVSEQVDLANLGNFAQLLEAPAVGVGTYVSVTFFLDYSSQYITVDTGNGSAGPVTLTDASTGTTPVTDTITVTFDPNNPLVIATNQSSLVNFNIDLEASNTIDYAAGVLPVPVTVHPMFSVTASPVYDKPVFTRGLFVFADTNQGNFTFNTRPLHDVLNNPFGALTVIPNASTYYNINGVTYVGAAGLKELSTLSSQTSTLQIAAIGTGSNTPPFNFTPPNTITPAFYASQVYAGTSLENLSQDHITGFVAARSGNTLTVEKAALVTRLGLYGFQQVVTVTTASSTLVSVDGDATASATSTLNSVSIGQYVDVSGLVTVDGANNPTALDATNGQIRMMPTTLWGTVNSATAGNLSLNLQSIQDYEPTFVDFTGTGAGTGQDATAATYAINTGATDESGAAAGSLLQVVGTTNAFGQGPPYFNATSITPATSLESELVLEWTGSGSPNPFTDVGAPAIYVNLDDALLNTTSAVVLQGPQPTPLAGAGHPSLLTITLPPAPSVPVGNPFTIGNTTNGTKVFSDPSAFATQVLYSIGAVGAIQKLVARGTYDAATTTFAATSVEIVVQ